MMVRVKRVYEPPTKADGFRILVDRLWPRGLSKAKARVDLWLREVAPSDGLRTWFAHDPEKWPEFRRRYRAELREKAEALHRLKQLQRAHRVVTLIYAASDSVRNNAVVLAGLLSAGRIGIFTDKEWKQIERLAVQPPAAVCENAEESLRYLKRHLDRRG